MYYVYLTYIYMVCKRYPGTGAPGTGHSVSSYLLGGYQHTFYTRPEVYYPYMYIYVYIGTKAQKTAYGRVPGSIKKYR